MCETESTAVQTAGMELFFTVVLHCATINGNHHCASLLVTRTQFPVGASLVVPGLASEVGNAAVYICVSECH